MADKLTAEWPEIAAQFGEENVAAIDLAIGHHLSNYPNGIRQEEFYLVSEGLTYAVFMALRDNSIRLTHAITSCSRCGGRGYLDGINDGPHPCPGCSQDTRPAELEAENARLRKKIERIEALPGNWRSIRDGVLSPGMSRAAESLRIALREHVDPEPWELGDGMRSGR
jgi:hypothetical protein